MGKCFYLQLNLFVLTRSTFSISVFYGLLNEPFQEVLRKKVGCCFIEKSAADRNRHNGNNNLRPPVSQISNIPASPVNPTTPLMSSKRKITFR
jgi:hypothetical protein